MQNDDGVNPPVRVTGDQYTEYEQAAYAKWVANPSSIYAFAQWKAITTITDAWSNDQGIPQSDALALDSFADDVETIASEHFDETTVSMQALERLLTNLFQSSSAR